MGARSGRCRLHAQLQKSSGLRIRGATQGFGRASPRDGGDVWNRMNVVQRTYRETHCPDRSGLNVVCLHGAPIEIVRRKIGLCRRSGRLSFAGAEHERVPRRSAGGGLPLFLRLSGDRSFHGCAGSGKTWRRGNDFGCRRLGFREQGGGRVDKSSDQFGRRNRRGLQGLMVIEHPSREQRFGGLLDPLIHQGGNFMPQICSVVEPSQLKTLQRGARSGLQVVERRSESRYGHGQSSNLRAGPKGPATKITGEQY